MTYYVLALVLYFSDGSKEQHTLYSTYSAEKCIDVRDGVRGGISQYNEIVESGEKVVDSKTKQMLEFVDVECHKEKKAL